MDYSLVAKTFDLLQEEGIISNWAMAGGSAALFYVEPFVTFDVDLFVGLEQQGVLLSLDRFHSRLRQLGHVVKGEHVDIGGLAVQIMAPADGIEADALAHPTTKMSGACEMNVVTAEYLMAICLKIGRPKDKLRLEMFLDEKAFDETLLLEILIRHGLLDKWQHYLKSRS